jgi:hypothetical protein
VGLLVVSLELCKGGQRGTQRMDVMSNIIVFDLYQRMEIQLTVKLSKWGLAGVDRAGANFQLATQYFLRQSLLRDGLARAICRF